MVGDERGLTEEDAPTPPGGAGTDWPLHMGLWLALVPLRAVAMVACGAALLLPVNWVVETILPRTDTLQDSFSRLGLVLVVSAVGGAAAGAVLTQPLGRNKLHPEARWWAALMSVILLAVIGLLVLVT